MARSYQQANGQLAFLLNANEQGYVPVPPSVAGQVMHQNVPLVQTVIQPQGSPPPVPYVGSGSTWGYQELGQPQIIQGPPMQSQPMAFYAPEQNTGLGWSAPPITPFHPQVPKHEHRVVDGAHSYETYSDNMDPQVVGVGTNVAREERITYVNINDYSGATVQDQIQAVISSHPVVLLSRSTCPFCFELKRTFTELGVPMHVMEHNKMARGGEVLNAGKKMTKQKTVPMCWVKGEFLGGCNDVKKLQHGALLEDKISDLIVTNKVNGADRFETMYAVPPPRGTSPRALFWFPAVVNNWVIRVTGILALMLCCLSMGYWNQIVGRWTAAFLLFDFSIRFLTGSFLSPLGMLATVLTAPLTPDFRPGAPKQFASFCGLTFSLISTCCYFTGNNIPGAVFMGGLCGACGLEGFLDFCLGCVFYGLGIRFGLIPKTVYRIFTNTKQETIEAWNYENTRSIQSKVPTPMDTDPSSKVALKYKQRTDEWTKDNFHPIKHMQVTYFGMPLAIAGLATAFKIATGMMATDLDRTRVRIWNTWYQVFGLISVAIFCIFTLLYLARLIIYPRKCIREWQCPLRSPSFGTITLCILLYAFLWWDTYPLVTKPFNLPPLFDIDMYFDNDTYQWLGRVLFWIGACGHITLTVAKMGEWVGKRLELEHLHATWMILPVGNIVAAMVAPVVPALHDNVGLPNSTLFASSPRSAIIVYDSNAWANLEIARFFYSVGYIMWVVLFVITFFKIATTHNSDDRIRHATWIWIAAPSLIAIVEFLMCNGRNLVWDTTEDQGECASLLSFYFFFSLIMFLALCWATLPYINHFGRDQFSMGYWIECFCVDTLAAAAALWYSVQGHYMGEVLMLITAIIAFTFNGVAFCHTLARLIRRRTIFCAEYKWSPLSFMKLTHEAVRAAIPKMTKLLEDVNVDNLSTIQVFCAQFAAFISLHEEHSRHEDEIIFKTFDDFFIGHPRKFNDDHDHDRQLIAGWKAQCNILINMSLPRDQRQAALSSLRSTIPPFLEHFLEHLQGEEDNLNPIGKRYINLELGKQIVRKSFETTTAAKWEVILPYLINNMPRHGQRVRLLKCFCWAMPERAQQIGAIVYRGCDSVKWELLSFELPEIIPRGAPNWRRYY